MDQLSFPIFLGISRRGIRGTGTEASNSRLFSRSTERTIRLLCPRPPFFSWLHFCPLLDILFYWTKPSFLPAFLAFPLTAFCFAVDYTREDTSLLSCGNLSTLSSSVLPPLPPATGRYHPPETPAPLFWRRAFVRDIVLFRVSNFKRYYSSFRETLSRILDLSSSISG